MIYAYIRVSTDKQTVENQRYVIEEYCRNYDIGVDEWVREVVSGKKSSDDKKLGKLLKKLKKRDTLISVNFTRVGRNVFNIMANLYELQQKNVRVILLDEKYELLNTMDSAIQAVIYSLNAHMTGVKISEATRQGLARRKAEGMILGRPVGSKNYTYKLTGKDHIIDKMLAEKKSKSAIARKLKVHRCTLITWLKKREEPVL